MSLGYQAHSDTSREAAQKNISAGAQREKILGILQANGIVGCTGDMLSHMLGINPGTISARLRDLELAGRVVKTKKRRKTRSKRTASVYMIKSIFSTSGEEADIKKKPTLRDYLMFHASDAAKELLTEYERKYGQ